MAKKRKRKLSKTAAKFHYVDEQGRLRRKETSIEEKTRKLLNSLGLQYIQEYRVQYKGWTKYYDFFVYKEDEYAFFIEANGEYFHPLNERGKLNPALKAKAGKSKKKFKLNKMQKQNAYNDMLKRRIAEKLGTPLIYLWETSIHSNIAQCKKLIMEQVDRQRKVYLEDGEPTE